ncbi:MAG: acetate--CoA ligase [archaeon]
MTEETNEKIFNPPAELSANAHIKSMEEYQKIYDESIADPEKFWAEKAGETLHWFKKWDNVHSWNPDTAECTWFEGGKLNAAYNCLDKHLEGSNKDKTAIIWEPEAGAEKKYTYAELHKEVCKFANALKGMGVQKGDRVAIYMPMIPELAIGMLACARIGAIHNIVFGGFSAESLSNRINDSKCKVLLTANGYYRAGKVINAKQIADTAVANCPSIEKVVVAKRIEDGLDVEMSEKDVWWHDAIAEQSEECVAEEMDAEDPLFILYTSGSTGKPKGVLHTTGGYMLYTTLTFKWIFDHKDNDVYWCTADIGWITGHSYIIYGPLCAGATSIMFESVPNYPEPDRAWKIVEKYGVTVFYTAPTAIRALMKDGETWPDKHEMKTLRILGSVGEPINPEAWRWYYKHVGKERCPILDTWWQTETGGILITPLPGATPLKPGSATFPFPGIEPIVINDKGEEVAANESGYLMIKKPWPSMMRTVYKDKQRFRDTYFKMFPGLYFTGDSARKDDDGYYWLMGRVDDVMNVSGHRMGTAEVESALVSHDAVAEAAVVPMPHDIKGEAIYAYVTLKTGREPSDELAKELQGHVRTEIGPIAKPDVIQFAPSLPKTRSGKIMRRILRKIATNEEDQIGDTSTLADPSVVDKLVAEHDRLVGK